MRSGALGVGYAAFAFLLGEGVTGAAADVAEFASDWPAQTQRVWVGPQYWANRLQDWRIRDGRLECVEGSKGKPRRTVHLLTRTVGEAGGTLKMSVRTGPIEPGGERHGDTWTGFLIGVGGEHVDYRISALTHHRPAEDGGMIAAVNGLGQIVWRDNRGGDPAGEASCSEGQGVADKATDDIELRLAAEPSGDKYKVTLSAYDYQTGQLMSRAALDGVDPEQVSGNLALVSHLGPKQDGDGLGYWFRDWRISGSKIVAHEELVFGPLLCCQHTLSRGVLKMTAQMGPLGQQDTRRAELQIRHRQDEPWPTVAEATLVDHSYTFPFRVENWEATRDAHYRVAYDLRTGPGSTRTCYYEGMVRMEPADRDTLVVAAFTGHHIGTRGPLRWNGNGISFPHPELVAAVAYHKPDVLFFSGDQVYESDLFGCQYGPLDKAILDYLDKWYKWCWAFGGLARNIPCICIPDDHDVFHGNLWGDGGRKMTTRQDDGGYRMDPIFVNMVQHTQSSQLPDPPDPAPALQGIEVYFTSLDYGGGSVAIREDRNFKSSPRKLIAEGQVDNGFFHNPDFDPAKDADVPGAVLLGERQLRFLRDWAADFSGGVWMKVALSQTIFTNISTLPKEATNNGVTREIPIPPPGVIPEGYHLAADADSNGWPPTGRNKALHELRRGFALHVSGDQHLGCVARYGIDDWDDAGYGFCVPSIANYFPRRWYPPEPGGNRKPGSPAYTGRYRDGFGNHMTVEAVSNPTITGRQPAALYDRAPGYGIVRFNRRTRDITIECWPRWVNPADPNARQYPGWPITMNQLDNYGRQPAAHLPAIEVTGMVDPVVQVIDENDGELVYTLRIKGTRFHPKVFKAGPYTVLVGEPGTGRMKKLQDMHPTEDDTKTIAVGL